MKKSETIGKISLALSKAQSEMPEVRKNAQNPFLKNKYADLGAVIESSRNVLAKNELAVAQFPISDGDKIGVTTILTHSSGEWLEDTILISTTDAKGLSVAQSAGVVISYLRRYAWASILGMYADEDTDGNHQKSSESIRNQTRREKLVFRYNDRLIRAAALGINTKVWELSDKMTDDEIGKLGVALNSEITKKTEGKENA